MSDINKNYKKDQESDSESNSELDSETDIESSSVSQTESDLEAELNGKKETNKEKNKQTNKEKNNQTKNKELSLEKKIEKLCQELNLVLKKNNFNSLDGELITIRFSDPHAYITLKIGECQLSCIYWRIKFTSEYLTYKKYKDGDKVKLEGFFTASKKNLNIYFDVRSMSKIGLGDYLALHNEYRKKIIELGWDQNKRQIQKFPSFISIITAIDGAAIHDILESFRSDGFVGKILIVNAVVQGKSCPQSVISKIDWVEKNYPESDIMMVTRGGGSYEDLVGFSDWDLVTKIKNTNFITMSAIGHQIDNQLSDEVSDYKFATPSLGAKFITSIQKEYINKFEYFKSVVKFYNNKLKETNEILKKIESNYSKIIFDYKIKEVKEKLYKYSSFVKNKITSYHNAKNNYLSLISNTQPKIIKNGI